MLYRALPAPRRRSSLLSDGYSTKGRDPITVARRARQLGVRIHTISLGTASGTIQVSNPDGSTRTTTVPPDGARTAAAAAWARLRAAMPVRRGLRG